MIFTDSTLPFLWASKNASILLAKVMSISDWSSLNSLQNLMSSLCFSSGDRSSFTLQYPAKEFTGSGLIASIASLIDFSLMFSSMIYLLLIECSNSVTNDTLQIALCLCHSRNLFCNSSFPESDINLSSSDSILLSFSTSI